MAGAAKRSRLSELHRMFTEALIEEIKQSKEDEVPLPAADKSVIAKVVRTMTSPRMQIPRRCRTFATNLMTK